MTGQPPRRVAAARASSGSLSFASALSECQAAGRSANVEQAVDALASGQQLGSGQLGQGFVLQRLQQAVQLAVGLFGPVELGQAVEQGGLLLVEQAAVGQAEIDWRRGR